MTLRVLQWVGLTLLVFVVLVAATVAWSINTQSGTRWALARVSAMLDDKLQMQDAEGTLAGPLTLIGVHYRDPAAGIDFSAERVSVDVALRALLSTTVQIEDASLQGVHLALSEPTQPPPPDTQPFTLKPPIDVVIKRFALRDAVVRRDDAVLVELTAADVVASWTDAGVAVEQLDVSSPQGEVHFQGKVQQDDVYLGDGRGRFRWTVGTQTYAGALTADATAQRTLVDVQMSAPVRSQLKINLQQSANIPWQMTLETPRFDPRESLLPDSSLTSIAASLQGSGDLNRAALSGQVVLNDVPIQFESLRVARLERGIDLDSLVKFGGGQIRARGDVLLETQPLTAKLDFNWQDVEVPAALAGQVLRTHGQLDFDGGPEKYSATGTVSLGPPARMADIALKLQGSQQRVQIEQFDIVQPKGRLAMTGRVELQPAIAWQVQAQARQFDPGAFAVAWPGALNFALATDGRMTDAGAQAQFKLTELRGKLRRRELAGSADLTLSPGPILQGMLDVRSGRSRVNLTGRGGQGMDVIATLDISALNDWLPSAGGELHGRFTAKGKWPQLAIAAEADGAHLSFNDIRTESLALNIDMHNPTQPEGTGRVQLRNAYVAGFEFATFDANVSGSQKQHRLALDASGQPLSTNLLLEGSLQPQGWSGTLQQLVLDVKDVAHLTLQEPVQIAYLEKSAQLSQACFTDRDIRLCVEGDQRADGVIDAKYSLQNVPLALANAFAPASLPVTLEGSLAGHGDVHRNAAGAFSGEAAISSEHGQIARRTDDLEATPVVLLKYDALRLNATLAGENARAALSARLNDTGALNGEAALSGLNDAATVVQGRVTASLPSLAVIEAFAPQLANVQGRADLQMEIGGTLNAPELEGELTASQVGLDVPELGLKLKEGVLKAQPRRSGEILLSGGIASGKGRIEFSGQAHTDGQLQLALQGENFQAAEIPGASVFVSPKLDIARTTQRMNVTGEVRVPSASVDLQKLPRREHLQQASADVVVIDAKSQEEAAQEALPVFAEVRIILGDKVDLVGFGLQAKVDGQLVVNERPGDATTGSGEIRVAGTYKAYGQDLTIRQGQLLYAGTPLDNPRLSIVAVREVDAITAGLRVTGTAQNPQLAVFSDPAMGQANALSYLVAGKPLDSIGQSEGESDAMQTAARSLGTAAGGVLAKNLGKRLGVDEAGIKNDEMIGGAAFTVGQYLSPRLYLSYGVGLFAPGQVLTLRYKLTKELAVEVQNGSVSSRAGIQYRIEK